MMKYFKFFIIIIIILFISGSRLFSAEEKKLPRDEFFPDFQEDRDMKSPDTSGKFSISYGGWIMPLIIYDYKYSTTTLASSVTTLKLWFKTTLWKNSYLYVRVKDELEGLIHQKGYELDQVDNNFAIDSAYIYMSDPNKRVSFYLGRKFFIVGSGLVFNGRGDGLELEFISKYIGFKIFGAYTGLYIQKENNPYNFSDSDISDGAKRLFTGGTVFTDFHNQTFYIIGVAQFDFGDEDSSAKSRYQSQYFGAGFKGVLFAGLNYYTEFIYEIGESYKGTTNEKGDIRAFGMISDFTYYFDALLNPTVTLQYAFGSGDSDRNDYENPTGNTSGDDTGFYTFGTYVGGYSLRPTLANIHVLRMGFSISPASMSKKTWVRRMTIISKYTCYLKDEKDAAIGDGEDGIGSEIFLGSGFDFSYRWAVFSDFAFFVNYAFFIPGDEYSYMGKRHFVMGGVNVSF